MRRARARALDPKNLIDVGFSSGERSRDDDSSMSEDKSLEEVQGADKAAAKIQAGFRGYRVRKRLQEEKKAKEKNNRNSDEVSAESEEDQDHMEKKQQQQHDVALEDKSATKIQAGVRGFLVRKRQQAEQAAATRIQAGFRGFRTRKLLKQTGQ